MRRADGAGVESLTTMRRRTTDLGRLRRHIFTLDPPPERTRAGDVRFFSAPGEAREALEIARRVLDEAGSGVRVRRDGGVPARAAAVPRACSSTRSSARACPRTSIAARVGRIRRAARSWRSSRAPARSCRPDASTNTCRSARCPRLGARRQPVAAIVPDDEAYARFDDRRSQSTARSGETLGRRRRRFRRRGDRRRHAARAVEVGRADRRVGGDRRRAIARTAAPLAPAARRSRRRLQLQLRRTGARGARFAAHRARIERDLRNLRICASSRCRSSTRSPTGRTRRRGASGSIASPRSRRACSQRPARVLRVLAELAADGVDRPGAARGSARCAAGAPADARTGSAGGALRPRVRRHAAPAARTRVPSGLRARAGRARVSAAGARGSAAARRGAARDERPPGHAVRSDGGRTVCCSGSRSAPRPSALYLSYPRLGAEMGDMRPRVPSFYALDVMRAITGRVPDDRALAAEAADGSRAQPGVAGAPRSGARHRRSRARSRRPQAAARHARRHAVKGHARYLLELNERSGEA